MTCPQQKMSAGAYSQQFGRRRRSLSLGRYDDERFYDQSYDRDFYDGEDNDRFFGRRGFGVRRPFGMNNFNHYGGNKFMNRYPDQPYFGYDNWYPGYGRFGYGRFMYNSPNYNDFGNYDFNYDQFRY